MKAYHTCYFNVRPHLKKWVKILQWQNIQRQPRVWDEELSWAVMQYNGKATGAEIYRMTMAGNIYHVWREMNLQVFQNKQRNADAITRLIIQEVHLRGSMNSRLAKKLQELNHYP